MAWESSLVTITRHLIGDVDETVYDDSRIRMALVVAGTLCINEYDFSTDYSFNLVAPDISPDPTESDSLDTAAMALFSLKAASMLDVNRYQKAMESGGGARVVDGETSVDLSTGFKGYKDIIDLGPTASYNKLLKKLSAAKSMNSFRIISTPAYLESIDGFGTSDVPRFFDTFV